MNHSMQEISYDDNNIFNQILKGTAPCHRIYEDEISLSFLDIAPQGPGHTLVIPKSLKIVGLLDFPPHKLSPFINSVQHVGKGLVSALNADGLEVQQLNGPAAGQTVFHLHFHLIPRFNGVPILTHTQAKRASHEELDQIARRIRKAF